VVERHAHMLYDVGMTSATTTTVMASTTPKRTYGD
jgi:hypothetical protein